MKQDNKVEKLNFSVEAQRRFDRLCENDDYCPWTWQGMAKAFHERFGRIDTEEFLTALKLELKR